MDYNYCNIEGRLTKDSVLSTTSSGKNVLKFNLAVNTMKDATDYFDFTLWGQRAESSVKYLTKGKHVVILCQARYQKWNDKQTGETRSRIVFDVLNVIYKDGGSKTSENPADEYVTKAAEEAKQQKEAPLPTCHFTDDIPFGVNPDDVPGPEKFKDDIPF